MIFLTSRKSKYPLDQQPFEEMFDPTAEKQDDPFGFREMERKAQAEQEAEEDKKERESRDFCISEKMATGNSKVPYGEE